MKIPPKTKKAVFLQTVRVMKNAVSSDRSKNTKAVLLLDSQKTKKAVAVSVRQKTKKAVVIFWTVRKMKKAVFVSDRYDH